MASGAAGDSFKFIKEINFLNESPKSPLTLAMYAPSTEKKPELRNTG